MCSMPLMPQYAPDSLGHLMLYALNAPHPIRVGHRGMEFLGQGRLLKKRRVFGWKIGSGFWEFRKPQNQIQNFSRPGKISSRSKFGFSILVFAF